MHLYVPQAIIALFNRYRAFRRACAMRCMLYAICCRMYASWGRLMASWAYIVKPWGLHVCSLGWHLGQCLLGFGVWGLRFGHHNAYPLETQKRYRNTFVLRTRPLVKRWCYQALKSHFVKITKSLSHYACAAKRSQHNTPVQNGRSVSAAIDGKTNIKSNVFWRL